MTVEKEAEVSLREVTEETLMDILKLEVTDEQKHFVAPNAWSIAQAHFSPYAWFRAIYADDAPVGFVMLYLDEDTPEYGIWRFMIDKRYQKRGYGYQAMQHILEFMKTLPDVTEILVSHEPGNGNPSPFYKKCGFIETDEWDEDEKVMKLTL